MERKVLRQLMKTDLSNEDAQKILAKHWKNVSLLKKQRETDRLRSLQLLKDRRNKAEFEVTIISSVNGTLSCDHFIQMM